ncbi:T9SS type A sorting domain-containing protein [uncultured Polaribacter sp.]|uniref:T9SS type A sorting domain-containing protein n=1 Tax=uncultured Polaribacter sp. TaxID=174711 RepID=UPI00261D703C|nr:T9SS type A sorting domain-containing protein [uncultured Polaribacter sp.]
MKKIVLFIALIATVLGYAQTFDNIPTGTGIYINKAIPSPNTDDLTNEYFEFRGTPNTLIPTTLYFIMVEGDGESGKTDMGKVKEVIQLGDGTRTFGSSGILAVVANYTDTDDSTVTTNPYTSVISANATIITIELAGTDVSSSSSSAVDTQTPDIGYDGNFTDASATYMLISATVNPKDIDIDADNDGQIDATGDHTTQWALFDSFSYLDLDDPVSGSETGEYGYGQIVFAREYDDNMSDFKITAGATIINQGSSNVSYILRQGTKTGFTADDWIIASNGGGSLPPNWTFSSTDSKVSPDAFLEYQMPNSIYGELNPTAEEVLLVDEVFSSKFSVYPNPANEFVTISSALEINNIEVYNLLGKKVISAEKLSDHNLDVSSLSKGVYMLKLTSGDSVASKKLIKR